MSTVESTTRAALHDVADDLTVSDDDLHRLEAEVTARLGEGRRTYPALTSGRSRWALAVAAVLVLLVGGLAAWQAARPTAAPVPAGRPSAGTTPAPSSGPARASARFDRDLVGLWRNGLDGEWLWAITADGGISWHGTAWGLLAGSYNRAPLETRSGDVYGIGRYPESCVLSMRIRLVGRDTARATVLGDDCTEDFQQGAEFTLDRVSGRDPSSPALRPSGSRGRSTTVASGEQIAGSWFEPASQTLLVVDAGQYAPGIHYLVDDDGDPTMAPDQRGTMSTSFGGELEVVPDARTARGCTPLFSSVVTDVATMTTTGAAGGCFPEGTTQTWIRLN